MVESDDEQELFFQCLLYNIRDLAKNPEARFVFKKTVQTFKPEYARRIFENIKPIFLEIACDKYGICVIKFLIKQFETDRLFIEDIAAEFMKTISKGKANSHFNFGLHHLLEVVNLNRWQIEEVESLIKFFFYRETRARIRSRAVAQTVLYSLDYFRSEFVDNFIIPKVGRVFSCPLNEQESELLTSIARSDKGLAVLVRRLRHHLETQQEGSLESPCLNSHGSRD